MEYAGFTIIPKIDQNTWPKFLNITEECFSEYSVVTYLWVDLKCVVIVYLVLYLWCICVLCGHIYTRACMQRPKNGLECWFSPSAFVVCYWDYTMLPGSQASRHSLISTSSSPVEHGDCRQDFNAYPGVGSRNSDSSGSHSCVVSTLPIIPSCVMILQMDIFTTFL